MKRSLISVVLALSCNTRPYTPPPDYVPLTEKTESFLEETATNQQKEISQNTITEELTKIEVKTYFDSLSSEYKAMLETISWAEYTLEPCVEGISPYQVLVAGKVVEDKHNRYGGKFEKCPGNYFVGFADHPRIKVKWHPRARPSTAAGKYQWMETTYDKLQMLQVCGPNKDENCGLFKDITPDSQDQACVFVVRNQNGVTQKMLEKAIHDGNFKPVWKKLARTWASLPYYDWRGRAVGYYRRQRNARSFVALKEKYMEKYEFYKSNHE